MATIQWRPEVNTLTTPLSYRILFLPRNVVNTNGMAARMAKALPSYSEEECRTFIEVHNKLIQECLSNGEQVTEENAFTYSLSFTGRLENADDPLPPLAECLQVRVYASPPMVNAVRQSGSTERLPPVKKLPLINAAKDTVFELKDVLNPQGLLQLNGNNLFFDRKQGTGECVIEGTADGRTVQTRFGKIEDGEITIIPDIPPQPFAWNNEYRVSISTRYSEHGTLRTGIYERMLRSPLGVSGLGNIPPLETGILTGAANSAYVSITGGTISVGGEATLRIQVVLDLQANCLRFNLLDMTEGGTVGTAVVVTENGVLTLQGFVGSAVSSLDLQVDDYAALKNMLRNDYNCRLVDVLVVRVA